MATNPSDDFKTATHTAIISDLHLCEAQAVDSRYPLWKKYKTKEFFFDQEFAEFLEHIEAQASGQPVELILNGDIFDFDSCMVQPSVPREVRGLKVTWLEKQRGLYPQEPKSVFKIRQILKEHPIWVQSLTGFLARGHRVVFVIGNHDLELHYPKVQQEVFEALGHTERVRICNWFYISNGDTLVEHGNQYDPYCVCQNPVFPFIRVSKKEEVRLPFGNLACRYLINGMGYFNPHVDENFVMSLHEYVRFFVKYIIRSQPFLLVTWFWGSTVTLWQAFRDVLSPAIKDPLTFEARINDIAYNSNATPPMTRAMRQLSCHPAAYNPLLLARELWLDQAFLVLFIFGGITTLFVYMKLLWNLSFYWLLFPMACFLPFFIFYGKTFKSKIYKYKSPKKRTLEVSGRITRTSRIVYGHTHEPLHEKIGEIEHLNCGVWSPAFTDVECTRRIGKKTFVWIRPDEEGKRKAELLKVTARTPPPPYHAFLLAP